MYRNIVVGYDGTDEARDALALASVLRARSGMVTAACSPADPDSAGAERTLASLGERTDSPSWLRTLRLAGGAEHLLRLVHDTDADLLVLGSSGSGEHGRTHTGPVGRRLLFGCHCPVAVAPRGFREVAAKPRTVTIAFGGEDEAASSLDEGLRLARSLGAGVSLLCLVPPAPVWALGAGADAGYDRRHVEHHHLSACGHLLPEAMAQVPQGVPTEGRLLEGLPADTLRRELDRGADLLVMASPGVRPAPGVRPGRTAIDVMRSSPCPVLLTPTGVREIADPGPAQPAAS
jgi:nucleotide-binding universal stress UspA family protein